MDVNKIQVIDDDGNELEFEVHDQREGYAKFLDIIKPFGIEYTSNCPSKIQRVYMQLEKLKL